LLISKYGLSPNELETLGFPAGSTWVLVLGVLSSLVTVGDWLNRLLINFFNIEDANMKRNIGTIVFLFTVCGAALWEHHQ
jgi:hypothetical protein